VDYDKAIELNPSNASAYFNRGMAKDDLRDFAGAIVDYDKAIELDPSDAWAYFSRGNAKYVFKNFAGAILDYDKAIEVDPTDPYPLYYRWVTHTKLEKADKVAFVLSSITDAVAKVAQSKRWEWKIGEYIAGTVSEADLLAAAASQDPKTQGQRHCEAFYFMGVKALANGDKTKAAGYFQKSDQTHCVEMVEYRMAQMELEELGGK
jgi:lipoprotein NlpI